MKKHYSVRQSVRDPRKFKIVLAGGAWGYEDIDLPLFDTLKEALGVLDSLESARLRR